MVKDGLNIWKDWIGFTSDFSWALRIGMALALGEQTGLIDRNTPTDTIDEATRENAMRQLKEKHRG